MDILLAVVSGSHSREYCRKHWSMPPLGLLYLSAYLKKETGLQAGLVDFQTERWSEKAFKQKLAADRPKIVGLSVYAEALRNARAVTAAVKSVLPSAIVVLGGAYAMFAEPKEFLKLPDVDVLVRGEGEVTFTELVRHVLGLPGSTPLDEIAGITFKNGSEVVVNPKRELISDLDSVPFPDRDLVDEHIQNEEYKIPFTVNTSRGCPGDCVFCSSRAFWGGRVRFRSPRNIVDELAMLVEKYGMRTFHIIDDTFTARPRVAMEFCRLLMEQGIKAHWSCASSVNTITEELLKSLYDAGCRNIQLGIESGVQEVLDSIGKHVTVEQVENAVRMATGLKIEVDGSFILGHWCDTPETMLRTIDFVCMLVEKYGLVPWMSMNTPFPGTPQFANRKRLGLTIHTKRLEDLVLSKVHVSAKGFSLEDLGRISIYGWNRLSGYLDPFAGTWVSRGTWISESKKNEATC